MSRIVSRFGDDAHSAELCASSLRQETMLDNSALAMVTETPQRFRHVKWREELECTARPKGEQVCRPATPKTAASYKLQVGTSKWERIRLRAQDFNGYASPIKFQISNLKFQIKPARIRTPLPGGRNFTNENPPNQGKFQRGSFGLIVGIRTLLYKA